MVFQRSNYVTTATLLNAILHVLIPTISCNEKESGEIVKHLFCTFQNFSEG